MVLQYVKVNSSTGSFLNSVYKTQSFLMQYWSERMRTNCLPQFCFCCFSCYFCCQNENLVSVEDEVFLEGKHDSKTKCFSI